MTTRPFEARRSRTAAVAAAALALTLTACGDDGGGGTTDGGDGGRSEVIIAGHQLADGTPFDLGLEEFATLVEEKTDGQVTVEVHPNAELGTEPEMFQAIQAGTMDVAIVAPGSIAEFVPDVSLLSMPFLVTSREQRDEIINGPIAEELATTMEETSGVIPMTYFGGGIRQMFFTEPAETIDDVQGRLFRVQPSEVLTDSFAAVGLEPTVVAYDELYNGLQTGVVEGAENESVFIESQKFFEPAPHILLTNHEVTIRPLVIGQATLDRLGEDLANAVLEAAEEAGTFERELEAQTDDEILAQLADLEGVTVVEADTAGVLERVQPVWEDFAGRWGREDMLQDIIDLRPAD